MRTLTIDVTDLGGAAQPGDTVVLWKPDLAGSASAAGRVISTAPVTVRLVDGKATVPDVEPGNMRVLLRCRGMESQGPIDVVVPDGTGTVTLRSLLESQFEYSPPVVSAVQQAADNAAASERAAIQAQVRSEAAADRAEDRVDEAINNGAELVRDEVKQDADRAVAAKNDAQAAQTAAELARDAAGMSETNAAQSENDAAQSASAAAMSASQAAENATSAAQDAAHAETARTEAVQAQAGAEQAEANAAASEQAAATSASNAATSEANAQDSATAAATSASEAAAHADRAEQAADPTGLRDEITQQIADLVDGAPEDLDTIREVAEYAQENRDITDALNAAIGAKADATDASGRTVARYEPGSSQILRVGDNPTLNGDYANSGALNLRSADSRYASKASMQALADGLATRVDGGTAVKKIEVVTAMPSNPVATTLYLVVS